MSEFLIWFVASFISTFGYTYLFCQLTETNTQTFKISIIIFWMGVLMLSLIKYFNVNFMSFSIFFLFYPILFYSINKLSFKKIIYYVLVIWLIGMILDLSLMLIISWLHELIGFDILNNWNVATIVLSVFVAFCLILIGRFKRIKLLVNNLYIKLFNIKYSDFLSLFLVFFIFISAFIILTSLPNLTVDVLLILLIILMVIVFIFIIKYKINEEEITKYLKILKENNEFYAVVDDENRVFKHNLIAKLLSIKSVSNKKGMILIDELIRDFNFNIDLSNHIKVIPYGLNGIIYQKLYPYFNKINLKIFNEIKYDIFENLSPLRYNVLTEKLSLVLDNALESSIKSKDKVIVINIFDESQNIVIEVKNTFSGNIDLDGLGVKNYSTKGKRRGLGLYSALRNNEVQLTVKIVNYLFVSKLVVKKTKKLYE